MLLAIDVGNTNLVLACGEADGEIRAVWRIHTDAVSDAATCIDLMRTTIGTAIDEVTGAIIASVVPDVTPHVVGALTTLTGTPPMVVGATGVELGIDVNIDRPEQAGADRLGLGANTGEAEENDDEFDQYRKRMMLAYRFRPNPMVRWPVVLARSLYIVFLYRTTRDDNTTED